MEIIIGAVTYALIFAGFFTVARVLRNRRWRRDARSNLARTLADCDGNTRPGTDTRTDTRADTGTVSDVGTDTKPITYTHGIGRYLDQYRTGNSGPRPGAIHRSDKRSGVVPGHVDGAPHLSTAPTVGQ